MNEKLESLIPTLPGWTSVEKARALYNIVKIANAKTVIEIGGFAGRATLPLAQAVKETGGKLYTIDPYSFKASLEGKNNPDHDKFWVEMDYDLMESLAKKTLKEQGLEAEFIKEKSQDVWNNFTSVNGPWIDVIFIDGNPSEKMSMMDVENYAPLIREDGFLILNDSNWTNKIRVRARILELGFSVFLEQTDSEKCCWTTYKKTNKPNVNLHPLETTIPFLPGWSSVKQCRTLYELVKLSKCKVSVDLGIFGGRTLYAMALAHKENKEGVCVGIDPWSVEACCEGNNDPENNSWWEKEVDFKQLYIGVVELMIKEDLTDYSNIVRFKSNEAVGLFSQIGVLSLDGNHSTEMSCKDVENYAPFIIEGGYIMMDDTLWPTVQPALELILNYGFEEIIRHDEGDGREWRVYRKLGGPKLDVTQILKEAQYE